MSRGWSYSSSVLINCRGFHETNAKAASLPQTEKKPTFLFVLKETPVWDLPYSFLPASSLSWQGGDATVVTGSKQECLPANASTSALSSVRTDRNIKNLRMAPSFHSMQMSYENISATDSFKTCCSPQWFQTTRELIAPAFALHQKHYKNIVPN